jgi:hypothetical protein
MSDAGTCDQILHLLTGEVIVCVLYGTGITQRIEGLNERTKRIALRTGSSLKILLQRSSPFSELFEEILTSRKCSPRSTCVLLSKFRIVTIVRRKSLIS